MNRFKGFTLIELMVVLVILGLLAGLVGPRLFGKVDSSKVRTADTQVKMIRGALQTYRLDVGRYPTTAQGLAALQIPPSKSPPTGTDPIWKMRYLMIPGESPIDMNFRWTTCRGLRSILLAQIRWKVARASMPTSAICGNSLRLPRRGSRRNLSNTGGFTLLELMSCCSWWD